MPLDRARARGARRGVDRAGRAGCSVAADDAVRAVRALAATGSAAAGLAGARATTRADRGEERSRSRDPAARWLDDVVPAAPARTCWGSGPELRRAFDERGSADAGGSDPAAPALLPRGRCWARSGAPRRDRLPRQAAGRWPGFPPAGAPWRPWSRPARRGSLQEAAGVVGSGCRATATRALVADALGGGPPAAGRPRRARRAWREVDAGPTGPLPRRSRRDGPPAVRAGGSPLRVEPWPTSRRPRRRHRRALPGHRARAADVRDLPAGRATARGTSMVWRDSRLRAGRRGAVGRVAGGWRPRRERESAARGMRRGDAPPGPFGWRVEASRGAATAEARAGRRGPASGAAAGSWSTVRRVRSGTDVGQVEASLRAWAGTRRC